MSEADAMHERLKAEWGVWCGQWRPAESSWAERNQKSAIRDLTQATYVGSLRADPAHPAIWSRRDVRLQEHQLCAGLK
jgi:hypothetical protein